MKIQGWIYVLTGLLAIGTGAIVLRGVLRTVLSGNRVVRFLEYSLIANVAGLLPLTRHLSRIQGICMLSVYCSGAAVLAWRKFHLTGLWYPVFTFLIVTILYLNVVCVSIGLFNLSSMFAVVSSGARFEILQFFLASVFAVLGALALRSCHSERTHLF